MMAKSGQWSSQNPQLMHSSRATTLDLPASLRASTLAGQKDTQIAQPLHQSGKMMISVCPLLFAIVDVSEGRLRAVTRLAAQHWL